MRELRAVRVSDDGKEILLTETIGAPSADSASGSGADSGFVLHADERLRTLLRPKPAGSETRPESALTPREIQSRLRAGDTAEDVARAAGIPVARVARYEAPIAAERVRIVDEVRRATAPGPHRVSPGRPLGAVVDERLSDDGFDPALAQWLARRQPDNTWMVTVDLADHHAEWSWDGQARRVRAHDAGAQRLLNPSRSSAESLIAVAQAAGVTSEPILPKTAPTTTSAPLAETPSADIEPHQPLAPARAVGESHGAESDAGAGRSGRSGFKILPGTGSEAPASPRSEVTATPSLTEIPGSGRMPGVPLGGGAATEPTWTPSANDVPGSGSTDSLPYEPPAETAEAADAEAAPARPARPAAKSNRRRSAVPAWDDIVFGARRS